MTVKVLGPLDTGTEPLSPRERAVLSALIVRLGSAMSPSELAAAYWGDRLPTTWAQQVKTAIARIRTRLGRETVETRGSEYALAIEPDVIDAVRFERLVSTARRHSLHSEFDRAADAYARALGLWRGAAYPDVTEWEPAVVEAMRLEEIRRSAEEELLDARLRAGDHRAVIPEAERLVREAPLREDRWAILALANYQTGRQAEALAVVRAARERLLDDLGIEPGARLTQLETGILRQDPALTPATLVMRVSPDCPYPGLAAFGTEDADEFFGRDGEIDEILARVAPGSITAVAGPSGSGKSSLMLAGVVPRLIARGRRVEVIRPGTASVARMRVIAEGAAGIDVVAVDQSEELLRTEGNDVAAFGEAAAAFLARGGCLVLTIRSDFLDEAAGLPAVGAAIARGVFLLGPLRSAAMREAIVEPARRAGLRLEPGLVELVLRDAAGRSTTLPPLAHALQETWARREGVALTVDGYEAAGGIAGAIAQSAEAMYQSLDEHGRELCRSTMLRLVERLDDGGSMRRRVAAAPLLAEGPRRSIIEALIAARLVTVDGDSLTVAHEAIATAWPRLEGWLEDDAEGARILRHLESTAAAWDAAGRPGDDLLRGARLEATVEWSATSDPDLTAAETEFLTASVAQRESELSAVSARAVRDRRQNRRLRWALAGAAVLLVAAVVSASLAVVRGDEATAAAEESRIQAVTSTSMSLLDTNREVAALLAVGSYREWPDDPRAGHALMSVMTEANPLVGNAFIPDTDWRIGAWPVPGTNLVAVVRDNTRLALHDLRTGEVVRTIDDLDGTDYLIRPWVRVSADGSTIAVVQHVDEPADGAGASDPDGDRDELVSFYDVGSGERVGERIRVDDIAVSVALNADGSLLTWATTGRLVVVARDAGEVRFTDVVRPKDAPPMEILASSTFAPDGTIVVSNRDDTGLIIDPVTLAVTGSFEVAEGSGAGEITTSSDGRITMLGPRSLSTAGADGATLWTQRLTDGDCSRIVTSAAQRLAMCGDEDGGIRRWDLDTGDRIGEKWSYQLGAAGDLALSSDETEVLLMSAISPSIARVRIDGSGPSSTTLGDPDATVSWGFDPSGRYVVLADGPSLATDAPRYEVWDTASSMRVLRIPEDLDLPDAPLLTDPRWVGEHELFVWQPDLETGSLPTAILDVRTGVLEPTALPTKVWWVFTDPRAEVAYVALNDIPETDEVESTELLAYALPSWTRLPFRFDAEGQIEHVSTDPDRTHVVVTELLGGDPAYRTTVLDESGSVVASGLPQSQATVVLPDGSIVAATATRLERFDPDTLERVGVLPGPGNFVWSLTASSNGLVLAHGASGSGVTLIDPITNRRVGGAIRASVGEKSAISPDGTGFVTSGERGVQYWTVDAAAQARAACELIGREPTPEEWVSYFADLGERHPICADG